MAEQRLIDATDLIARGNASFGGVSDAVLLKKFVDAQPTIDPETMPIVRQLREELARVTAERDAAVSDLENIMAYNSDTCQSCKNNQCYVRGGTKPCLPKWRGPQKEE